MFFDGYMAAPPTITVFSFDISLFILSCALAGTKMVAVNASAPIAAADKSVVLLDIVISSGCVEAARGGRATKLLDCFDHTRDTSGGICGFNKEFVVIEGAASPPVYDEPRRVRQRGEPP